MSARTPCSRSRIHSISATYARSYWNPPCRSTSKFVKEHSQDPRLREQLANAYFRLGDITRVIGTSQDALDCYRSVLRDLGTPGQVRSREPRVSEPAGGLLLRFRPAQAGGESSRIPDLSGQGRLQSIRSSQRKARPSRGSSRVWPRVAPRWAFVSPWTSGWTRVLIT